MTVRVRRAASRSIPDKLRWAGGLILEVVAVRQPPGLDPDADQHLDDPVDLLDTGQASEGGAPVVEQRMRTTVRRAAFLLS